MSTPRRSWRRRRRWCSARLRLRLLEAGVIMPAPDTVQLCADTEIGPGAVIEPYVVLGPGVRIGPGAVIHSFSHLERATRRRRSGDRAVRAPAAGLATSAKGRRSATSSRPRTPARAGRQGQPSELSRRHHRRRAANIGAGTITCNYDGFGKYATQDRRGRVHRLEYRPGGPGRGRRRAPSSPPAARSPTTCRTTGSPSPGRARQPTRTARSSCASGCACRKGA